MALLELQGVAKHFGAIEALKGVDLTIEPGDVVGLMGDNGAGKSTLVKAIAGIHSLDEGRIRFEGRDVSISRPQDATALGIATVYQDLALCDNLDVVANLFLGREEISPGPGTVSRQLDEARMEHRTGELLSGISVTIPSLRSEVGTLSGGQRQQVAVARSLLGKPKVVLLDEPTAALGVAQTAQVLQLIRTLRERGLGVVVISHNLVDVFEVADRIFVLRLGRAAGSFAAEATTEEHVVSAITGVGERGEGNREPQGEPQQGESQEEER
jgi:D-xylose transport system ATP-binding protein